MSIHDGHRSRLKNRFLKYGLESFDDHNVLELLLFYSRPRGDVNPLAHKLMDEYKSLDKLFDAPVEELIKIDGVGENTAILLKLVPQIYRRYAMSRTESDLILDTSVKAGEYLVPRFIGERDEVVYTLCMDAKRKLLDCRMLCRGNVNTASVNMRKIVETALASNASCVIIAHNHISGVALPSNEDIITTRHVCAALSMVGIDLVDHIIVADNDFISFADSGINYDRPGGRRHA